MTTLTVDERRAADYWRTHLWCDTPDPDLVVKNQMFQEDAGAAVVLDFVARGILPAPRRYFEPGFAFGRNLATLYAAIGGEPYGLEIDQRAADAVRASIPTVRVYVENIFTFDFGQFPTGFFDLTFTRSFLFFLPRSQRKRRVIADLQRISQFVLALEVPSLRVPEWVEGDRYHGWDDYQEYGFACRYGYSATAQRPKNVVAWTWERRLTAMEETG